MACPLITIDFPITDNSSTVFFNIKYPQSLITELAHELNPQSPKPDELVKGLQDELTQSLMPWTEKMYIRDSKKIRFVAILDVVNSCTASFHLTTDNDGPFTSLPPTRAVVITVKGRISQLTKDTDCITYSDLEEVYSTLLGILTRPKYKLSIQNILIDRIEMISPEEKCLQENLIKQIKSKTAFEYELELKQKEKKISELEEDIQTLKGLNIDGDNGSMELSLTSSLTTGQKKRRKRKTKK